MYNFFKKYLPETYYFQLIGFFYSIPYFLLRMVPINKRKIVFSNFNGKGFGDNPKYIALEIIKRNLDLELVWLIDDVNDHKLPKEIRPVKSNSFLAIFELVTANVWVDNSRKSFFTKKRRNQIYIHTWHAGIMLKRVEQDVQENLSLHYRLNAINDSKMIDFVLSNSDFYNKFYQNSFWYNGPILELGFPKTDILLNADVSLVQRTKSKLELENKVKIALYAPTFRDSQRLDIYIQDYQKIIKSLNYKFDQNWILLVRLHPSMAKCGDLMSFPQNVKNVSNYDDMQELLLISDVLFTDYSSSMFEYMLLKRPIFLFWNDLELYKKERGFYFSSDKLPFPLADSELKLSENILNFNPDQYFKSLDMFISSMRISENGTASTKVVDKIIHILNLN
jgi:CDP-glycerol glycerophosphotransferase